MIASDDVVAAERRNRIRLAVAAYAYEFENDPILSDEDFDALAKAIQPHVTTGHPVLDEFFLARFQPYTGLWVREHPDIAGLARTYNRLWRP